MSNVGEKNIYSINKEKLVSDVDDLMDAVPEENEVE